MIRNTLSASVALGLALATLPPVHAQTTKATSDTIETVLVRAAREPIDLNALGNPATLLDGKTLERRQQAALGEILRSVPGLAVNRTGVMGSQTQLRMRGSEANHVLVLIDGVRANDPAQNDEFNIAHLMNYDVEAVEIVRGPQSALWGSDAMAGVINIRTASGQRNSASIFAEGGSNAWQNYGARGSLSGERFNAAASISYLETDGENISRTGDEDDGYDNLTANLNAAFEASDALRLEASLRYTDASNDFDRVDFATGLPTDSANRTDARQFYGRLAAILRAGDRWVHTLGYARTSTENFNLSENAFAPSGFDESESDADINLFTYQASFSLSPAQRLTGALEYQEQDFRQRGPVSFFGDPNRDESIDISSLILEYSAEVGDNLSLVVGARHDSNSDFDDATTGRLSAAWTPFGADSGTRLRASFGTGVKNPTFTERFGFFTNFVGNPNLKPEESRGWDLGIDQRLLEDRLSLSLTWFSSTLRDEINGFAFDPASGGFTAVNEDGESEREGIEFNGNWLLSDSLDLRFAYTWLDASEDDGSREIRRPENIASLGVNWQFAAERANLNLSVDYNGTQDDFFFPPVPPFQERVELNAFTLLNIAASYALTPRFELFARVENALDENYEEVFGFQAMGRTAYAGARYRFAD